MKRSLFRLLIPLICLLLATWDVLAAPPQQESSDPSACSPIDAIFLVDQSTSMSEGGNDPENQREFAVEVMIDLMADIALDSCPGIIHRVGVISYGTDAVVDLPLTEIGPFNPSQPNVAFEQRTALKEPVRATELGQTNPAAAFVLAKEMLDEAAPMDDGERTRKRAIIFITDGIPCVDNDLGVCGPSYPAAQYMIRLRGQIVSGFSFDPIALQREQCLRAVREAMPDPDAELPFDERQRCLTEFEATPDRYQDSTFIWVTLMRDANRPYPNSVYRVWEDITDNYAGRVIDVSNNRNDIPTAFRGVLQQLTGVRAARLECGNFAVNPYLKKAVFNFNKFDPTVAVTLSYTDVNGTEYTLVNNQHEGGFDVTEHLVSGPNERYEIAYPHPGLWSISSEDCDGLDAFYQPIQASPQSANIPSVIAQYDLPPFYNPENPLYLEFQFIDASTRQIVPAADHPQFAIEVTADVTGPNGSHTYALEKVPNEDRYRTTEPLPVNTAGDYTVKLRATTAWHDGEPNIVSADYPQVFAGERVLLDQTTGFTVRPVTPFRLDVVTPADGETIQPIHVAPGPDTPPTIAPIPVRLRLANRDDTPFTDWAVALPRPNDTFVAEMTVDGQVVAAPLRPDPQKPGEFIGELDGVPQAGEMTIAVRLSDLRDPSLLNEDYYPDNPTQPVTFKRQDETWRFRFVTPVDGETQRPIHDTIWQNGFHWPLNVLPVPVQVELIDADGQPYAAPEEVMAYAPRAIAATLEIGDNLTSAYLEPDPDNPGQYVGEIVSGGERGEQTITADLDYSFPDYDPASEPARTTFTRADAFFTSASSYYLLLALLLLFLAFLVYRYFAIRSNPVRGQLVFSQGNQRTELPLHNGKNVRSFKKKELDNYPDLLLDKLRVSSIKRSSKKRRGRQDGADSFDSWAGSGTGGPSVRVEYQIKGSKTKTPTVPSDGNVPLEGSPFSMTYISEPSGENN